MIQQMIKKASPFLAYGIEKEAAIRGPEENKRLTQLLRGEAAA